MSPNTSLVCWEKSRLVRVELDAGGEDQWLTAGCIDGGSTAPEGNKLGSEGNNENVELLLGEKSRRA